MQPLSNIQALVVDDNRQMRFLVRSMLRAGGVLRVAEADSADDALTLMRRISVDLIIVDWCMRPVDGIAFTRRVRMDPTSPNPYGAIVMISAHSERSRVAAARDAGVNSFLVKPISTRSLFEHVSAALADARPFIRADDYFGPDRRRGAIESYCGPFRRKSDRDGHDELLLDTA